MYRNQSECGNGPLISISKGSHMCRIRARVVPVLLSLSSMPVRCGVTLGVSPCAYVFTCGLHITIVWSFMLCGLHITFVWSLPGVIGKHVLPPYRIRMSAT